VGRVSAGERESCKRFCASFWRESVQVLPARSSIRVSGVRVRMHTRQLCARLHAWYCMGTRHVCMYIPARVMCTRASRNRNTPCACVPAHVSVRVCVSCHARVPVPVRAHVLVQVRYTIHSHPSEAFIIGCVMALWPLANMGLATHHLPGSDLLRCALVFVPGRERDGGGGGGGMLRARANV